MHVEELTNYKKFQRLFPAFGEFKKHIISFQKPWISSGLPKSRSVSSAETSGKDTTSTGFLVKFVTPFLQVNNLRKDTFWVEIYCLWFCDFPYKNNIQSRMYKGRAYCKLHNVRRVLNGSRHDISLTLFSQHREKFVLCCYGFFPYFAFHLFFRFPYHVHLLSS